MATVIVTIKLMPESPDVDFGKIKQQAKQIITEITGESQMKLEEEPVAFGLKALKLVVAYDEKKGGTDAIEQKLKEIPGVNSVETTDVRRALG